MRRLVVLVTLLGLFHATGCWLSSDKSLSPYQREIKERRQMYGLKTPGLDDLD